MHHAFIHLCMLHSFIHAHIRASIHLATPGQVTLQVEILDLLSNVTWFFFSDHVCTASSLATFYSFWVLIMSYFIQSFIHSFITSFLPLFIHSCAPPSLHSSLHSSRLHDHPGALSLYLWRCKSQMDGKNELWSFELWPRSRQTRAADEKQADRRNEHWMTDWLTELTN